MTIPIASKKIKPIRLLLNSGLEAINQPKSVNVTFDIDSLNSA